MKWIPSVPLETLRGWERAYSDVVFAIGNFDGVHLGHQALLRAARERADELGCRSGVLTFAPHPRRYFAGPETKPFLLTRGVDERAALRTAQLLRERRALDARAAARDLSDARVPPPDEPHSTLRARHLDARYL